jgi:Holliday junction resolvase-like predicted endonuclease
METTQTYSESPNFQTVWATLMEVAESQRDTDRRMKETDMQIKETDRITRENAKLIGNLGGRFGEMAAHLVAPKLADKFNELGFIFEKIYRNTVIKDREKKFITEVDITLENGDYVIIVEVKTKLTTEDITDHVDRMMKIRAHADLHGDKRKYLGAVAGIVMTDNEKAYAFKCGFYVIEPSGETFSISEPQGSYSVREF